MRPLVILALPAAAFCLTANSVPARAIDETGVALSLRTLLTSQTLYNNTQGSETGAGIDLLFHRRSLTFGANLDLSSGSGQVDAYAGVLFGGELPLLEHLRLGILGEFGAHRLADPGTVSSWNGYSRRLDGATLPYGGGRISLDLLVGGAVALDLGADVVARADIGRTDTALRLGSASVTSYRFGGKMLGGGAHLGIRF
jgi:hypothetical protein